MSRSETGEEQGRIFDVIVLGAGITGLTTAFYLQKAGLSVAVLEAADEVGGAIRSVRDGDWLFELGPNTVVESRPEVPRLLADAGLSAHRIEAQPTAAKRYVWTGRGLLSLPGSPPALLTSPLFSVGAKLRLLREPFVGRGTEEDESIASFVRRRLGTEVLDHAVAPFVSGVWAGDPERLSAAWAMPKLAALERDHGSLLLGALRGRRRAESSGLGAMVSLEGGLAELPRRLAQQVDVRLAAPCRSVDRASDGMWVVEGDGFRERCRRLVATPPADRMAELLAASTEGRSRRLAEIPYVPLAVVGLGYRRNSVSHALDGFGFLTAADGPKRRILGGLFSSQLFAGRAPEGAVAITSFIGGRRQPEILEREDSELLASAHEDLSEALGIGEEPIHHVLHRWPRAIPQYETGHAAYVEAAREIEARLPGLTLAGNYLTGISLPDCVARGVDIAREILGAES